MKNDTAKLSQKCKVAISLGHQYSLATKNLKELKKSNLDNLRLIKKQPNLPWRSKAIKVIRMGEKRGGATQALQGQLPKIKYLHIGFIMQKNSKHCKKLTINLSDVRYIGLQKNRSFISALPNHAALFYMSMSLSTNPWCYLLTKKIQVCFNLHLVDKWIFLL